MGVGLGNSIQTTGYLPEALSDSIFSVIGEIWGFLGTMAIMAIYVVVLFRILDVSRKTEDGERSLFAAGVFAWLVAHVIINVGGMTGIIPMKGITLPFLSYGGTSMMFIAYAMGAVLQLSGWTKREVIDEDSSSRRGKRRARNAGYRRS
jgi:cell division protein FtsW